MKRLVLLSALAAAVSGCAPALSYTADDCWRDKECRRAWKAEVASEMTELERVERRGRHIKHVHKVRSRDGDVVFAGRADRIGPLCQSLVVATGERAQSEEAALNKALSAWQQQVQFRFGESYTGFHLAKRPERLCAPAGLADTLTGKIMQKGLGINHWRCELRGYPCRERPESMHKDD